MCCMNVYGNSETLRVQLIVLDLFGKVQEEKILPQTKLLLII